MTSPLDLFYRGQYAEVLALHRSKKLGNSEPERLAVLGSLAFSGDSELARSLGEEWTAAFTLRGQATALFYECLGALRASHYAQAKKILVALARRLRGEAAGPAHYALYQSLAFFHFFTGRYRASKRYARAALAYAVKDRHSFFEALTLDLLGHSQIQLGEIQAGLRDLKKAIDICAQSEFLPLRDSIRFMVSQTEAFFGLRPDSVVRDCENALKKLNPSNIFARGELLLELSRQHSLRGHFAAAEKALEGAAEHILKTENRRQLCKLNVAIAGLSQLRGHRLPALSQLYNARKHLDAKIDQALMAIVEGSLYRLEPTPERRERLIGFYRRSRSALQLRHLRRAGIELAEFADALPEAGQDKLGDLIDELSAGSLKAFYRALGEGYYGLLAFYFRLPPHQRALVVDAEGLNFWILEPDSIRPVDFGQSQILRKILRELTQSPRTKIELTEAVWGSAFHPLRNEPAFFRALTRLKQELNAFSPFILVDGDTYRLGKDVVVVRLKDRVAQTPREAEPPRTRLETREIPLRARLSKRQQRALENIEKHGELSAPELAKLCRVTRMTAFRDLNELCEMGLLFRAGKARQTRYRIT